MSSKTSKKGKNTIKHKTTNTNITVLICGYMRLKFNKYTPNVIVKVIILFYGYNSAFIAFNDDFIKKTNDIINITDIYINKRNIFYVTTLNELYIDGSRVIETLKRYNDKNLITDKVNSSLKKHLFFTDKNGVSIISRGIPNLHWFIYTVNNKLYGFGKNGNSQLGIRQHINKITQIEINNIMKSNIIQIECGDSHSIFLTKLGNVFGCGNNSDYQLTNQLKGNSILLTQIPSIKNIIKIGCGENSSFVFNNNGVIYSFGKNSFGMLGIGRDNNNSKNGNINKIHSIKFAYFDVILYHVGGYTNNGDIYFWGYNAYYQCGTNKYDSDIFKPLKLSKNITDVYTIKCGSFHTIIKTYNNEYYSFGDNSANELLLIHRIDDTKIYIPTLINNDYIKDCTQYFGDIIDIIPGHDETFILQKC